MIIDELNNSGRYRELHPLFGEVFDYLGGLDYQSLKTGRTECCGGLFYINVDEVEMRPSCEAFPEAHNRYIDIQVPITREELVGYLPRSSCAHVRSESSERDIVFYDDSPDSYFKLAPGSFAIFFPEDAHAPIIGEGLTKKIVVKVPVVVDSSVGRFL